MYPSKFLAYTSCVSKQAFGLSQLCIQASLWLIPILYPSKLLAYPSCVSKQTFVLSQLCIQASFFTLTRGVFTLISGYPSKFWLIPVVYPGNFLTYPRCVSKQAFGLSQLCIQASFWFIQIVYPSKLLVYPSCVSK